MIKQKTSSIGNLCKECDHKRNETVVARKKVTQKEEVLSQASTRQTGSLVPVPDCAMMLRLQICEFYLASIWTARKIGVTREL